MPLNQKHLIKLGVFVQLPPRSRSGETSPPRRDKPEKRYACPLASQLVENGMGLLVLSGVEVEPLLKVF